MITAFDNGGGGYERKLGVLLQIRQVGYTAVAHCGFYLIKACLHIVVERACIGYIGIHAFFKGEFAGTTQVVTLPIPGTVGAFPPVLFHISAVYHYLRCGGLVEAGKVSAQHQEICTHCQSQGHVVIVNNTTIRANGDINSGFLKIFITGSCNFNQRGCLTSADALGLASDADGTAADADLHEIGTCVSKEQETFFIHNIASTDFYGVAIVLSYPGNGLFLPAGKAFGGVDAKHICTGLHQRRNALCIVAGVDTCTN